MAISVLSQNTSKEIIANFGYKSGRDTDKFASVEHFTTEDGIPVLSQDALGWFKGEVQSETDLGSHILFLVKVDQCDMLDHEGNPLTYCYYRNVMKGKSPKSAPTYINIEHINQENKEETMNNSGIWVCEVCGYRYDPKEGDPDSGIAPGTPFEDLPDDWVCPLCGVDKTNFVKE